MHHKFFYAADNFCNAVLILDSENPTTSPTFAPFLKKLNAGKALMPSFSAICCARSVLTLMNLTLEYFCAYLFKKREK